MYYLKKFLHPRMSFTLVFAASMDNFSLKKDKLNVAWSVAKAPKAQKNFCHCKTEKIIIIVHSFIIWDNEKIVNMQSKFYKVSSKKEKKNENIKSQWCTLHKL